ncbi:MAG: DUF2157 domain-containing protein [Alphaproteobacteria bacterium]|nr:MAG: DUF2157 domain-containing protein [Alphaproteobacteria bacterium]
MSSSKQDALIEVVDIMKRHSLTLEEVYAALQGSAEFKAQKSGGILMRVFGYLGGLFVFAGIGTFIAMQWEGMGTAGHIICTLGFGFCLFVMALACNSNEKFSPAATPLFLISALLQPMGIGVAMAEFAHGGNPAYGLLFMLLVMAIQQGCTFWAKDLTVLALTTLLFGGAFFAVAFEEMDIPEELNGFILGVSLSCIGWALDKSKHKAIAWVCYLIGSVLVLAVAGWALHDSPGEILFLGLGAGYIFLSTVVRSRTLLVVGMLATLSFVTYYMEKVFGDSLIGPIGLVIVGALLIGAGVMTVKINTKYIKQRG